MRPASLILIFCLSFLITSCSDGFEYPNQAPQPSSSISRNDFRIELISGDNQTYTGWSPEPIKFRVFNLTTSEYLDRLWIDQDLFDFNFYSEQGEFRYADHPAINGNLRFVRSDCDCFVVHWLILDNNDPRIGMPVDQVDIMFSITYTGTDIPIFDSPLVLTHFVE